MLGLSRYSADTRRNMRPLIAPKIAIYTQLDEVPIWNYWNAQNDVRYLYESVKRKKDLEGLKEIPVLHAIWDDLQWQYLSAFGYSEKMVKILDLRLKRLKHQIKFDKGDKFQVTFLNIIDKQIEKLTKEISGSGNDSGEVSLEDAISSIEEHRKVRLDPYTTSAKQFFSYSDRLVQFAKKQEAMMLKLKSKRGK